MSSEYNQEDLKLSLAKSVITAGLRDKLAENGIPSDENVTFHIQRGDHVLVSYEIPKKSPKIIISKVASNLADDINDFFALAQAHHGLLDIIHRSDTTTNLYKLRFDIGKFPSGESSVSSVSSVENIRQQIIILAAICCPPVCPTCVFVDPRQLESL